MKIKPIAISLASIVLLGACLSVPSTQAQNHRMTSIQVECDDVFALCVSMGYDEEYCRELAWRMCSDVDDDNNEP